MNLDPRVISAVVARVLSQLVGLPADAKISAEIIADDPVTVRVPILGKFNGEVAITAPRDFIVVAASTMFSKEPSSIGPSDLSDALGEIGNQVAGGVKQLLPGPSTLDCPIFESQTYGLNGIDHRLAQASCCCGSWQIDVALRQLIKEPVRI